MSVPIFESRGSTCSLDSLLRSAHSPRLSLPLSPASPRCIMPQSLARLLTHIIFSTKNRQPFLIDPSLRAEMHAVLGGLCSDKSCPPIVVGGVADHVHILCSLSKNIALADLVGHVKRGSSKWIKERDSTVSRFHWQNGYGAFSIGGSQLARVREYIAHQEEHHRHRSFQEEFRGFLKKYGIDYDERFVWD